MIGAVAQAGLLTLRHVDAELLEQRVDDGHSGSELLRSVAVERQSE